MKILWRIFGGSLMAVGATFVAMAVVEVAGGGDGHTTRGVYAGIVVFFSALALGGWRIWLAAPSWGSASASRQRAPELTALDVEQRILGAAAQSDGRVTVGEVAMACRIPIAQAKQTLERMVLAGAAELLLTDGGDTVYRIAGLLPAAAKEAATDPLADVLPGAERRPR